MGHMLQTACPTDLADDLRPVHSISAAAAAAGRTSMSVAQFEQLLLDTAAHSPNLASLAGVLPSCTRLLFGEGCDQSAVQAADVCRGWEAIEADLQQRLQQGDVDTGQPQLQLAAAQQVVKALRVVLQLLVQTGAMDEGEEAQLQGVYKQVRTRLAAAAAAVYPGAAAAAGGAAALPAAAAAAAPRTRGIQTGAQDEQAGNAPLLHADGPAPAAPAPAPAATAVHAMHQQQPQEQQQEQQQQQSKPNHGPSLAAVYAAWQHSDCYSSEHNLKTNWGFLRSHAQVLHGSDCDLASVPAVELCQQWPAIAEHLTQRLQGEVNGKQQLSHSSVRHSFGALGSLLKWLREQDHVSETEQQQLEQHFKDARGRFAAAVGAAAAAAGAAGAHVASASDAECCSEEADSDVGGPKTPAAAAAAAGAATPGAARSAARSAAAAANAAAAVPARTGAQRQAAGSGRQQRRQRQQQQSGGRAFNGASLADVYAAWDRTYWRKHYTQHWGYLRSHAQLLYGPDADLASVPALELCLQWSAIKQHLTQRLRPRSAQLSFQALDSLLSWLRTHEHVSAAEEQQLQKQYRAVHRRFAAAAGGAAGASVSSAASESESEFESDSESESADGVVGGPHTPAAAAAAPTVAAAQANAAAVRTRQQQQAPNASITLAQVYEQWRPWCSSRELQSRGDVLRSHVQLLYGPDVDLGSVPALQLCKQCDGIAQQLIQRVQGEVGGKQQLRPRSAKTMFKVVGSLVTWLCENGHGGMREQQEQLRQQYLEALRQLLQAGAAGAIAAAAATAPAIAAGVAQTLTADEALHTDVEDIPSPPAAAPAAAAGPSTAQRQQQKLRGRQTRQQAHSGPTVSPAGAAPRTTAAAAAAAAAQATEVAGVQAVSDDDVSEGSGSDVDDTQPAAAAAAAAPRHGRLRRPQQHQEQQPQSTMQLPGPHSSIISLAQVYAQWQQTGCFTPGATQKRWQFLRTQAHVLFGPEADLASVPALELCRQVDSYAEHLLQRVQGEVDGKQQLRLRSAQTMLNALSSMLNWLCVHGHVGTAEQQQQLRQQLKQARRRLAAAAAAAEAGSGSQGDEGQSSDEDDSSSPAPLPPAAAAAAGASNSQRQQQQQRQRRTRQQISSPTVSEVLEEMRARGRYSEGRLYSIQGVAGQVVRLLHGPGAEPAAASAVEVCRQWQLLEEHLLLRIRGAVEGKPRMQPVTAHNNMAVLLSLLNWLGDEGCVEEDEVQQLQEHYKAAQVRLGGAPALAAASPAAAAAAGASPGARAANAFPAAAAARTGRAAANKGRTRTAETTRRSLSPLPAAAAATAPPPAAAGRVTGTSKGRRCRTTTAAATPASAAAATTQQAAALGAATFNTAGTSAMQPSAGHQQARVACSGPAPPAARAPRTTRAARAAAGTGTGSPGSDSSNPQHATGATSPAAAAAAATAAAAAAAAQGPAAAAAAAAAAGAAAVTGPAIAAAAAAAAGAQVNNMERLRLHAKAAPPPPDASAALPPAAAAACVAGHSRSFIAAENWLYQLLPLLNADQGLRLSFRRGMRLLEGLPTADAKLTCFWKDYQALLLDLGWLVDPAAPELQQEEVVSSLRSLANNALNETVGHA